MLIVDSSLLPLYERFKGAAGGIREVIVIADDEPAPQGCRDYEALLEAESDVFDGPADRRAAGGGDVLHVGHHRAPQGRRLQSPLDRAAHTLAACMTDSLGICENDRILVVVPMFHANAWGIPFCAAMTGASLIFPERDLRAPEPLLDLMAAERPHGRRRGADDLGRHPGRPR